MKTLEDMEVRKFLDGDLESALGTLELLLDNDNLRSIKVLRAGIQELKQYRETMGRVFEKAKIARLNMYIDKDRSYEHLVEIREIEKALKEGKAILEGKKP